MLILIFKKIKTGYFGSPIKSSGWQVPRLVAITPLIATFKSQNVALPESGRRKIARARLRPTGRVRSVVFNVATLVVGRRGRHELNGRCRRRLGGGSDGGSSGPRAHPVINQTVVWSGILLVALHFACIPVSIHSIFVLCRRALVLGRQIFKMLTLIGFSPFCDLLKNCC